MNPDECADVAGSDDGHRGWVTVRVVTDGGSLRLGSQDGELVDEADARDLVWDDEVPA